MERDKIQMLLNLFKTSDATVWIIDEDWKIIGSNYPFPTQKTASDLLKIDTECWKNIEKDIYMNNYFFHCSLYCNREERFRVAVLKVYRSNKNSSTDCDTINAVQNLQLMKQQMDSYIQTHSDFEYPNLPDFLERTSLLIYRKYYLENFIQSVQNCEVPIYPFFFSDVMKDIENQLSVFLEGYAELQFHIPKKKDVHFTANADLFKIVLLSGIVLCHQERGYFHHIDLSMKFHKNDTAEITLTLTPDLTKPISMSSQLDALSFRTHKEEEKLLTLFCMMYDGKWSLPSPNRFRLQFCLANPKGKITFQSKKIIPRDFEDLYKLMLAPVYLSEL